MRTNGPANPWRALRRLAPVIAALSIGFAVNAGQAAAQEAEAMLITVDQAAILQLNSPAGTVIIGNPAIADATIVDAQTLVVTGRSFGTTNLIILDDAGNLLTNELITVQAASNQVVVYRRSVRQTYSCTPVCAPTLNVGDGDPTFQTVNEQIQARQALALGF